MIIAFSGVQGSGKDTLARRVYEWLKSDKGISVVYFSSVTRNILVEYDINLNELRKSVEGLKVWQYYTFKEFIETVVDLNCVYEVVVTPRSVEDYMIYSKIGIGQWFVDKLKCKFRKEIEIFNNFAIKCYLEPLNNKSEIDDGVRDVSWYEKEIEQFEKIKDKYDLIIPMMDVEKRFELVKSFIERKL